MALCKSPSSFNRRLSGAKIRPENLPRCLFATLLLEQAVWWGGQESVVAASPEITCPEITWPGPSEIPRQAPGSASGHLKRFYIDNDAFVSEHSFQLDPPLALRASYLERNLTGISNLATLGRKALNLRLDESPIIGPAFVVYGELDLDLFGSEIEHNWVDDQQRFLNLGLAGSQGPASYGASYSFRGNKHGCVINREKDTDSEPGHQRSELWARWQFDHVGIKGTISRTQSWGTIEEDSSEPKIVDTRAGLTFDYALSSWPYVGASVGYFRGDREGLYEQEEGTRVQDATEWGEGALYYNGDIWDVSLYSSYLRTLDKSKQSLLPSATWVHYLSGSYRPLNTLSITPGVGYYVEDYFGARTINHNAYLTMSYVPESSNLDLTAVGTYDKQENKRWSLDTQTLNLGAGVTFSLHKTLLSQETLSIHLNYSRYTDAVYPDSSSEDLAVWMVWSIRLSEQ